MRPSGWVRLEDSAIQTLGLIQISTAMIGKGQLDQGDVIHRRRAGRAPGVTLDVIAPLWVVERQISE